MAALLKCPSVFDNFGKWFLCVKSACRAVRKVRREALGAGSGTGPLGSSFPGVSVGYRVCHQCGLSGHTGRGAEPAARESYAFG